MFKLATCEPYSQMIHGNGPIGQYIVIYDYPLNEFYNNDWKDETKFYIKNALKHSYDHESIRHYKHILKNCNKMQLVEMIIDSEGRQLCILHTYKINIIKRLWKKYMNY